MRTALAFFVATLALAAAYIQINSRPSGPDASLYEGIAWNLAQGNGYSYDRQPPYRPELTRSPFVPLVGAALYAVVGREPVAFFWLNAVFIATAVALGYLVALRLFHRRRVAIAGTVIAGLAPQVAGSAPLFLTEPTAMVLLLVSILLLLAFPAWRERPHLPWRLAGLGLVLAALCLTRTNLIPAVLIAAGWIATGLLRGRWRDRSAWLALGAFCLTLGGPVLGWSARNAANGLPFTPLPAGGGAGYLWEMHRYRAVVLPRNVRLPEINAEFWNHWKEPLGPDEIKRLDRANMAWFHDFVRRHPDRIIGAMPDRALNLFSNPRLGAYGEPWGRRYEREGVLAMRWTSRVIWGLSLVGMILAWRHREARAIWLVLIVTLLPFHLLTACNPRYTTPLLPLLAPYGGVTLVAVWDRLRRLAPRRST